MCPKRNGTTEEVSFDKILARIKLLCVGEEFDNKLNIDPTVIAQRCVLKYMTEYQQKH